MMRWYILTCKTAFNVFCKNYNVYAEWNVFFLKVDATFLLESSRPVYSEIGSAKHQKEVHIMNFLQDYLQEIDDSGMF